MEDLFTVELLVQNAIRHIVKNITTEEKKLNDHHMNYAQSLLKNQFPSINGLISTPACIKTILSRKLQHDPGHTFRWRSCKEGTVKDYDSVYTL